MSSTFSDFSGRQNLPVDRYVRPRNLNELCAAVQSVSAGGRAGHAMGTGWAMSAPAYSPDTVIRTDLLRGFPTTLQNAIVDPEPSAGTVLVAVEAGIRIRDLYLALSADSPWKPVIDAVLSPATQQLGAPTALVVTVRDDVGQPLSGATVQITNYPNEKLVQQTDVSGVATFNVTFRMQRNFDPETRQWEDEQPTGRVSANGFKGSDLPLVFEEPVPPAIDTAPLALRSTLSRGRDLEMMTMGGVGAQSLCGATSTGTHGSDVARPPIGDYIRAMVVVGSGGVVRLLQRDGSPPVVDFARLKAELAATLPGAAIEDATGTETFNAALLAMGRFGVVYACVLEVHDASDQFTYQHRSWSTWNDVKANLVAVVERARLADQFLQIVVNPVRPPDGNRRCYITRQAQLPRSRAATAGAEFESNTLTDNPAGDPVAFTTEFPGQGLCMRVVYRGTDGRLHEIASTDPGGGVFGHADLTLLAGAPLAAGDPVAFTTEFPGQGLCMRVVYRGTDGRLHEIASTDPGGGVFGHADLTLLAGAPLAAGDPVAFTTEFPGQGLCMRVVYRGTDGRLHEIASTDPGGGVFGHADLTLLAGIQPPQASMSLAEHQRLPEPSIPIPSEWRAVADTVAHLGRHFGAGLGPAPTGSGLCSPTMTSELNELRHTLSIVGMAPVPGSNMFRAAADSLGRISGAHKLGDVVADALSVGPPQIVDQIISGVFDVNQRPRLVHGRRWEVSDNYDYNNDCYRGDAVELFFPVDDRLADKARLVFEVFDTLRSRGTPLAAWISLRFMTPSQATLATAAFEPVTCAIEVSMLRGIAANTWALAALHDVARNHGGLVHWGLRNDLTAAEVTTMFGDRHRTWSQALAAMEGTSTTFSNPFSRNHGLEPPPGQTLPAERTQVPDVHGMSRAEARAAVRSALLKPQFTGSGTWAASQTPDPDTDVEVGSTVTCRFTGSQPN